MRAGRRACPAARAMTQTAAYVNATRVSTADQPTTGGRCKRKKTKTRPKKRSIVVRLPNSWAVQGGGGAFRPFFSFGFQGVNATPPCQGWVQAVRFTRQEATYTRITRG